MAGIKRCVGRGRQLNCANSGGGFVEYFLGGSIGIGLIR